MAYQKSPLLCTVWSSLLFVAMFSTRVVMVRSIEGPTFPWKGPPRAFCWNCKVRAVLIGWIRHFLAVVSRCLGDVEGDNPRDCSRSSLRCCWEFDYSGTWLRVVGRVVPSTFRKVKRWSSIDLEDEGTAIPHGTSVTACPATLGHITAPI